MDQQRARKTFNYTLLPTPEQERTVATVVWRCRELYNAGLQERKAAWEQCHISVSFAMQSAQLPTIKAVPPDDRDRNAQVLQDVLHRLDNAFAACFRRVQAGERPGYPRLQGADRSTSFTSAQVGAHGGAVLDGTMLALSKIGRLRIRLHRPLHGTPKTVTISREADGWYACSSCADVPSVPLPCTGRATSIDVGLKVCLITAERHPIDNPRSYRTAEPALRKAQRRVARRKKGSKRRHKAVALLKRTHLKVQRQRRHFHHTKVRCSCADAPTRPLPRTGRETGIDVGLTVFLITADGEVVAPPPLQHGGAAPPESPPPGPSPQAEQ